MEFELWWLLPIPVVFFALGWIAARIDIKHLLRESRALPLSYFRGLNFLLNEQPDKAIESFIEVVKVDPQTDRPALRARAASSAARARSTARSACTRTCSTAPTCRRTSARAADFELAQDFHRAGLLDRAEELFTKLDGTPFEHASLASCISIYEQEKDWPKAIVVTRRMEALAKQPYFKEIAHYHCELAQAALLASDFAAARRHIDEALADVSRLRARDDAAGRPATRSRASWRGDSRVAADRVAESGVPVARRGTAGRRLSQVWATSAQGIARAPRLPAAVSVARPAQHASSR